jgi:ketosteroid isomerase-like protein
VQRLIDNDNEKNLEGVLAGYTDDAILLPPKAATITGKDAIRSHYERLFSGSTIKLSFKYAEIGASGDLGFVRGVVEGTVAPRAEAPPDLVNDKFIALLRCDQGQWRVSHLMWSPESR